MDSLLPKLLNSLRYHKKEEKAQLLHFIGNERFKIYSTFKFEEDQKDKLKELTKYDKHFLRKENLIYLRKV